MLKKILLIVGTFYLLFYPPIFGVHSLRVMSVISIAYLLIRFPGARNYFNINKLSKVYITWIVITIWIALVILINGTSWGSLNSYVYWLVSVIPASLMIGNEIRRDGGNIYQIIDLTLSAGFLQGVCSVLAFFIPTIKNFFLSQMVSAEIIDLSHYGYYVNMRLYGFANGLTYAMPVLQAFLAMIAIYLAINKSMKYLCFVPFTLFSAVINARTSLVVIGACGLIILLQRKTGSTKKMRRAVLLAASAIVIFFIGIKILQIYAPNTLLWIADGAGQIELFFRGDFERGYFSYLIDADRWRLPSGLSLFFGRGMRILGDNNSGYYTDVGYVNDIWLGGIAYVVVIYAIIYRYFKRFSKSDITNPQIKAFLRYLSASLLVSGLLLNLKGYVVNLNCMVNFFVLITTFQSLTKSREIVYKD